MDSTLEIELDQRDIKLAHRLYASKLCGVTVRSFFLALIPFGVLGAFFLLSGGNWIYVGVAVLAAGVGLGIYSGSAVWRVYRRKMTDTHELFSRMSRPLYRLRFTDDGVHSQTELNSGQMAWRGFRELLRTPDVWLLFITKHRYLVFPTARLPLELQNFIVQKCYEHKIPVA